MDYAICGNQLPHDRLHDVVTFNFLRCSFDSGVSCRSLTLPPKAHPHYLPYLAALKAMVMTALMQRPQLQDIQPPRAAPGEVVVDLLAAALNHRDLYITQGLYPGVQVPIVLGSDGVGVHQGQRVLIQPGLKWGEREDVQGADYEILGMPHDGTFAEAIAVPQDNLFACPAYLTDEQAAALPLAGLTAYRALFVRGQAQQGETVLVTGAGGGVAIMAVQLAVAAGCKVFVTSSSLAKVAFAKTLGAQGGVIYTHEDWIVDLKSISGGLDVIIDGAGGAGFSQLVPLVQPGGRMVFYGGTQGKFAPMSPQTLFWRQISMFGSTMGSPRDFAAMVGFAEAHQIKPVVDSVRPLAELNDALDRMAAGKQQGKLVVTTR